MVTKSELQLFIRSGGYAWPGGYQCALLMSDGECVDAQSARENYRQIRRNMTPVPTNRDWKPIEVFIHWEGDPLICAHSGREIPSAYGPVESEANPRTRIFWQAAQRMRDAGITVDTDPSYSTVSIDAPGQESIFMQGEDADSFIGECRKLWNRYPSLPMDVAELVIAEPYTDLWS